MTEKEIKEKGVGCCESCTCFQKKVLVGYKYGLGFWLSGLTIWILVSAVVAVLYYFV